MRGEFSALTRWVGCGGLLRSDNRRSRPSVELEVAHVAGVGEEDSQLLSDAAKVRLSTRPNRERTAFTDSGGRVAPLPREQREQPVADPSEGIRVGEVARGLEQQ